MGSILTTGTEPDILETIRFVAMVRGAHEVAVAQSTREMLQRARRDRPSLAVWDLGFEDRVGSQHFARWYEDATLRSIPVVLLTNGASAARYALPAPLPTGTTCLEKPVDLVEFGLRVGALLDPDNGVSMLPAGHRRQVGELALDYHLFQVTVREKTISLTPTEFKLLRHLMENPGQTFSSEQLLDEVWKYPPGVGSLDVVRMYIKRLRDKMEPDPRNPVYIVTIPGHGYRIPMPETASGAAIVSTDLTDGLGTSINGHCLSGRATADINDAFHEILQALQTVTLTCQATLATVTFLMDEVATTGNNRRAEGGSVKLKPSLGPNGRRLNTDRVETIAGLAQEERGRIFSYRGHWNGSDPSAEDIAAAAQSLNGLATELQETLTQLQGNWAGGRLQPASVSRVG